MITITCISQVDYKEYDEVWAIVRSTKSKNPRIKQVQELSPSPQLYNEYLQIKANGDWGKEKFDTMYVPQFLKEMHSQSAKNRLNELYIKDKEGKNICLVCFCPLEYLCHRSIVAGLLQGVGCNVNGCENYTKYYEMYKAM